MTMKRNWKKGLKFLVFAIVALSVSGLVVMSLWNWLMPALFALGRITFWQALGVLVLSRILFGGFQGRPGPGRHIRRRVMAQWEQMTPEQREKFREGMRQGCGPFAPPRTEPKA